MSVCVPPVVTGQDRNEVLTNTDIVTLTDAGLPASVILAKIAATHTAFETTVAEIVTLSEAGVDVRVIEAMLAEGEAADPPNHRTVDQSVDQPIEFGDDTGKFAQDGECDDPRFEGAGMGLAMGNTSHRGHDATDCRELFNAGRVSLRTVDVGDVDVDFDFGDDAGRFAQDGECDDPRFEGAGMGLAMGNTSHRGHDATDCRELFNAGRVSLRTVDVGDVDVDFGDDAGRFAQDGECDDPRFEGAGMGVPLTSHRGHDATDCRRLFNASTIRLSGLD